MHSEIRMDPVKVSQLIGACAVLHNIAILRNDMYNPGEAMLENDQPEVPHMMVLKMGCKLEITFVNITSECCKILLLCRT